MKPLMNVFKTKKPVAGKVLSILVEKICSEVKGLERVDTFDEVTSPILANLLNTPGLFELIYAIRECPLRCPPGRSSWIGSRAWGKDPSVSQGSSNSIGDTKQSGGGGAGNYSSVLEK